VFESQAYTSLFTYATLYSKQQAGAHEASRYKLEIISYLKRGYLGTKFNICDWEIVRGVAKTGDMAGDITVPRHVQGFKDRPFFLQFK